MIDLSHHETADTYYRRAHGFAVFAGIVHLLVCVGLGVVTGTLALALLVGAPAVAFPAWLAHRYPIALLSRLGMAVGFAILTGVTIQQSGGDPEAHFSFFVMMSILVVYCDWRPLALAAAGMIAHHLAFSIVQTGDGAFYVWNDYRNPWGHFTVHLIGAALHTVALVYLSTMLNNRMMLKIQNAALGQSVRSLREAVSRDSLTGLYNRHHLERITQDIEGWITPGGETVSVCIVDIDHFKRVNDRYGHPAGDAVLRSVARTIAESLKASDCAVRQGGEEFIAILRNCGPADALAMGEVLRKRIEASSATARSIQVKVTASVGVATWRVGETFNECYVRADCALYAAKTGGRNRVEGADTGLPSPLDAAPPHHRLRA